MINPQKPVINPIKNFNRFTALIFRKQLTKGIKPSYVFSLQMFVEREDSQLT